MEAHTQNTTSTIVEELQPVPQQEASTSQQAIQPPHPTATTAEQHLRLRLVPKKKKKKKGVAWAEDVVDNELMGKKKSKKCCIFHKQRQFGEWSDSDSDMECEECNTNTEDGGEGSL
ncbi:hypothetical protein Ndes2437B_g01497 [Nannochloris sp. 'desiccata']